MIEIKIDSCPYCGGKDLCWGYQSAQGAITTGRSGFAGSKVEHLICTDCGSIVHSKVSKPELFKTIVKEKKPRRRRKDIKAEKAAEAKTTAAEDRVE